MASNPEFEAKIDRDDHGRFADKTGSEKVAAAIDARFNVGADKARAIVAARVARSRSQAEPGQRALAVKVEWKPDAHAIEQAIALQQHADALSRDLMERFGTEKTAAGISRLTVRVASTITTERGEVAVVGTYHPSSQTVRLSPEVLRAIHGAGASGDTGLEASARASAIRTYAHEVIHSAGHSAVFFMAATADKATLAAHETIEEATTEIASGHFEKAVAASLGIEHEPNDQGRHLDFDRNGVPFVTGGLTYTTYCARFARLVAHSNGLLGGGGSSATKRLNDTVASEAIAHRKLAPEARIKRLASGYLKGAGVDADHPRRRAALDVVKTAVTEWLGSEPQGFADEDRGFALIQQRLDAALGRQKR